MRAVVCANGELSVQTLPALQPGSGQVLLNVLRCGICGSDLHARSHCDELADLFAAGGFDAMMRSHQSVVMGHEFCGEIVEYGPGTRRPWKPGTPVVAMPILRHGRDPHPTGLSAHASGGYAEQVLAQECMTFAVPNGLSADHAALTEPMAVAWHAVRKGRVSSKRTAFVIGCGPVGLAVIALLKASGVRTVIASDFSPRRRELATRCGADIVVDPAVEGPWDHAPEKDRAADAVETLNLGFDIMERLRRIPHLPWWYAFRALHTFDLGPTGPDVFECVGAPGIIEQIIAAAPPRSRVVVVGVCMETDRFQPVMAINKEVELRFALGYDPGEFRDALHMIADGKVDPTPLITGTVGLDGVGGAFTALASPDYHAKILIDPTIKATDPRGHRIDQTLP
ncbi:zinc-binding dehydrogenase [Nocardia sp. NPDC006630]|uniref:zinc-binding dehydrogenase n=1 Tax=Nocardia sp. NPDC006630 TaxID=3157181 RepID=UPI00339FEA31